MNEIISLQLDNEMDLILAHKNVMRLAELAGLPLSAQTTFATAVSEVSRNAIGPDYNACLTLYISPKTERIKFIIAVLEDNRPDFSAITDEGYAYAKKLIPNINATTDGDTNTIHINYRLPSTFKIDDILIEKWRIHLNADPAVSPYEEIKRKNQQLIEMAEKLRESEQQYRSLTNSLPIIIYSCTTDGTITYANEWLRSFTGHTIAEINNSKWANIIAADDQHIVHSNLQQKAEGKNIITIPEVRLKDAGSGEYRWHTGATIAIKENEGIISWNTFLVDISAQKMIEQTLTDNRQLKEIQSQLEEKVTLLNQSNQRLEQFAYITSHDLQEPLRKISLYSDFLNKRFGQLLPAEAGMFFDNLINATDRMKILIQDILAYSTIIKKEFVPVNLNDVFTDALQDLEIAINEKNAIITTDDLPLMDGDSRQLKQLFENLLSNSLKFAKVGVQPLISITAKIRSGNVLLTFTDNGIGFNENYIDKMFDLFQKFHGRNKYNGTGIGLAICKKIVELHKGTISANSKHGEGASFLISLPLKHTDI